MRIAVLTFEGFNELDSFVASAMLKRVKRPDLRALIVSPAQRVASMNGVVVESQAPLNFAREADAVIVGSGRDTRSLVRDPDLMGELKLDPSRRSSLPNAPGRSYSRSLEFSRTSRRAPIPRQSPGSKKPASESWISRLSPTGTSLQPEAASLLTISRRG